MSKTKKPAQKKSFGGPFLAAAVFCENVVKDSSGMLSAVRILDNITLHIPANVEMPKEFPIAVNFLIILRSGGSPGKHRIKVFIESPAGKRKDAVTETAEFGKEPNNGANIDARVALSVHMPGVYWFDVLVDGKLLTRAPLGVDVVRVPAPTQTPAAAQPATPKSSRRAKRSKRT